MARTQRYVSNELTHFVGRDGASEDAQYDRLLGILRSGLLSSTPDRPSEKGFIIMPPDEKLSTNKAYLPSCVCFCDIPVADFGLHMDKYGRFGLSFSKAFLVALGANPVHYVALDSMMAFFDQRSYPELVKGVDSQEALEEAINKGYQNVSRGAYFDLVHDQFEEAFRVAKAGLENQIPRNEEYWKKVFTLENAEAFLRFEVFGFTKFFLSSGQEDDAENYYMEREWRVLGSVRFAMKDVVSMILPRSYAKRFREDIPTFDGQVLFADT